MSQSLKKIRVVLVEPSHPGNIGAVARAMKTMGLTRLVMVKPKKFPHYEASKRAAGAESVLENAVVVSSVKDAIADCTMVLGTSVRDREVTWPTFDPKVSAANMIEHIDSANQGHEVAILFGRENSGLSNQEMDLCQSQIRIPANHEYSSLNLASAVQIIAYELRMKSHTVAANETEYDSIEPSAFDQRQLAATKKQQQGYMEHLQKTLEALDFIKTKPPTMLMRKLTRLYNKAELTVEEIQILRGILSAIDNKLM